MKLSGPFNYTTLDKLNNSQLIELPYREVAEVSEVTAKNATEEGIAKSHTSMYVLLPAEDNDIRTVATQLTSELLEEAIGNLSVTTVRLILPKFNITAQYDLKSSLKALGIAHAFTYKSDLSGIDGTNYLHVSDVYHKTIIEVDEEGSQAVAATGPQTRGLFGRYRNVPIVRANRPFLFFVRHKSSGTLLFVGLLNKP